MSLSFYLEKHQLSYEEFGALIGVTGTTVYRYVKGDRLPTRKVMAKIANATSGKITANDFYNQTNGHTTSKKTKTRSQ
jgi:transcriptional regulator with XRE-family HTH domain